jgi:hypothetical protein
VKKCQPYERVASYSNPEDAGDGSYRSEKAVVVDPNAPLPPSFDWLELGVDEGWAIARRLVGAAWSRGRYELGGLRQEALSLGEGLLSAEVATRDRATVEKERDLQEAEAVATRERVAAAEARAAAAEAKAEARVAEVGLYTLTPVVTYSLKAPDFQPLSYEVKNWFQSFLSNGSTCPATPRGLHRRRGTAVRGDEPGGGVRGGHQGEGGGD